MEPSRNSRRNRPTTGARYRLVGSSDRAVGREPRPNIAWPRVGTAHNSHSSIPVDAPKPVRLVGGRLQATCSAEWYSAVRPTGSRRTVRWCGGLAGCGLVIESGVRAAALRNATAQGGWRQWGMEQGAGSRERSVRGWELEARSPGSGFGGSPKPTRQRRVLPVGTASHEQAGRVSRLGGHAGTGPPNRHPDPKGKPLCSGGCATLPASVGVAVLNLGVLRL